MHLTVISLPFVRKKKKPSDTCSYEMIHNTEIKCIRLLIQQKIAVCLRRGLIVFLKR